MSEKKLSEELRHCLEGNGCADCTCYEQKSVLTCPCLLKKAYEMVKWYEEMFPCKVGDTVYEVQKLRKRIQPYEIIALKIGRLSGLFYYWEAKGSDGIYGKINGFSGSEIGKTVFLSKEAAEKALKEDRKNG